MAHINFHTPYTIEREGQMEFFDNYGIPYNDDASVLVDNTDGVYNGNLFEFKLNINNLNRTLFQAVKYLSRMRIKGESVPAAILLVDLNTTTVYVYHSRDYFDDIHKIYTGAASKDNEGFTAGEYTERLDYSDAFQSSRVKHLLKDSKKDPDEMYMPINIDENCIVGWAERYYREKPKASKGDFLGDDTGTAVKVTGEIREPRHFKGLINPYKGTSNERFKYLMDCLNDRLSKKDLGAFYTPIPYAKKAAELVQMAVERVPEGNDYIILDRCAGTGNLESALIGLYDKHGDELISHCVVSTYEYYEYKVLQERIGDKVREIIPPTEANVVYENGKVANADAMSKEFIENPIIRQFVDSPKCTVILFENPPYADSTANTFRDSNGKGGKSSRTGSYVHQQYCGITNTLNEGKASARDFANLFIWSGFEYYLRQPTDSYIVFSPVKYFKTVGLAKKRLITGYLFNRQHFHATASAISCMLWTNEDDNATSRYSLPAYDVCDGKTAKVADVEIAKCNSTFIVWYDRTIHTGDIEVETWCEADGSPTGRTPRTDVPAYYNEDIVASLCAAGYSLDAQHRGLTRQVYFHHGLFFYIRKDNYLNKLPLWVSKFYPEDNWYEKNVYFNSADGGDAYTRDANFLKSCLIYTCLSNQNKCLSFDGSDGRRYQNELCFDDSMDKQPLALKDLHAYAADPATALDADETQLMEVWKKILKAATKTTNYNSEFNYGVYQITKELNTWTETGAGRSKTRVYDYPELNGDLETLRKLLKDYYKSHITGKMFQYELLK